MTNEYDPLIYSVQQVEGIDYITLPLFTSAKDKACLRDLLNSRSSVGEAENVIKEFLSEKLKMRLRSSCLIELTVAYLLISLLC